MTSERTIEVRKMAQHVSFVRSTSEIPREDFVDHIARQNIVIGHAVLASLLAEALVQLAEKGGVYAEDD